MLLAASLAFVGLLLQVPSARLEPFLLAPLLLKSPLASLLSLNLHIDLERRLALVVVRFASIRNI